MYGMVKEMAPELQTSKARDPVRSGPILAMDPGSYLTDLGYVGIYARGLIVLYLYWEISRLPILGIQTCPSLAPVTHGLTAKNPVTWINTHLGWVSIL